ncbi:hypothetical protein E2F48_03730 [Arthrobacter crusticola]|uniref:Uncharacterized protein n=1 Tax=Arthrobacter crusticola TaxID=2547960 RepID=A0A4V3AN49_9MICC|nr:hypothetical protein [Arthrobacter crusticola]TDK28204.1 hypothetical protein E2F48_03730 [Arthrobacter crusticola]
MSGTSPDPVYGRQDLRKYLILIGGFTAALCWWIGLTGFVNSGGGAAVFFGIPVLLTLGTLLAARRRRPRAPKHLKKFRRRPVVIRLRRGPKGSLTIIGVFTAALCWWIAVVGFVNAGGGAGVFFTIPFLLTLGTLWAAQNRDRTTARRHP